MKTYHDLPAPSQEKLANSAALCTIIKERIQAKNGWMPFADFMELALYHPQYGCYQRPDFRLGKHGDFTTAPEISTLFAECLLRQCLQVFESGIRPAILELGAGSGRLALNLLAGMDKLGAMPQQYFIYEISPALVSQQQTLLKSERPDLFNRVTWLSALPANFSGIILANEVLDAIPFHCFEIQNNLPRERGVTLSGDEFIWQTKTPAGILAAEAEKIYMDYTLPNGYQFELQLPAMSLVSQLTAALESGIIVFADYGYGRRELYHPERRQGTLTCFYQHRSHNNPLLYPGLQDITAHVDFTRVIETAADCGAELTGFTTQSAFLLGNGLLEIAATREQTLSASDTFAMHQEIKILTMPTEMGDIIKMMALSKNKRIPLNGFSMLDRRRDLS